MKTALQNYFDTLKNKRIYVIGMGVSNMPLIEKMLDAGLDVTACDRRLRSAFGGKIEALEERGLSVCLGDDYLDHLDGAQVIFRTPGMRPDLPQLVAAIEQGAQLTSEMEAFFQLCPCKIIAVTGSDGKTTTTSIIAGLLKAAGYRTFVGGNIGHPLLCEVDDINPDDVVVLELSSFQLMTMRQSASVAVVTNLAPNHLDVHKDMDEYVDAKRNIFLHQESEDKLIINADNEITAAFSVQARGEVVTFGRSTSADIRLKNGSISYHGHEILQTRDIAIPGDHNQENYMAAIAAVDGLVPDEIIVSFAKSFGGVAHRIEFVREVNGVRYYNDSIASSPSRTIAGLHSFDQKVILIAGGYDKHIPYDVLGPHITECVKSLILTGDTSEKIQNAVLAAPDYRPGVPEITLCEDLESAVKTAHAAAQPGDIVLLSPASASFDRFKNFEERGNRFKEFVQLL